MSLSGTVFDYHAGNTFTLNVNASIPDGLYVEKAWLTVKEDPTLTDDNAAMQKIITASASSGVGQITDSGVTSNIAALRFEVSAQESHDLGSTDYLYDIQVKFQDGSIATFESGKWKLKQRVTQALS